MIDAVTAWIRSWLSGKAAIPRGADVASEHWADVPLYPVAGGVRRPTRSPPPLPPRRTQPTAAAVPDLGANPEEAAEWEEIIARAKAMGAVAAPAVAKAAPIAEDEDWEDALRQASERTPPPLKPPTAAGRGPARPPSRSPTPPGIGAPAPARPRPAWLGAQSPGHRHCPPAPAAAQNRLRARS
jgi:hypothetical protein